MRNIALLIACFFVWSVFGEREGFISSQADSQEHDKREANSVIEGRVIGRDTGRGIAEVKLIIYKVYDELNERTVITDKDGYYNYKCSKRGRYRIALDFVHFPFEHPNNYINERYTDRKDIGLYIIVPMLGKRVKAPDIILELGGAISGKVLSRDIEHVCATAPYEGNRWYSCDSARGGGPYVIYGVPPSKATLNIVVGDSFLFFPGGKTNYHTIKSGINVKAGETTKVDIDLDYSVIDDKIPDKDDVVIIHHKKPDVSVDVSHFINAGCVEKSGIIDCSKIGLEKRFSCDTLDIPLDSFGALTPKVPIVVCNSRPCSHADRMKWKEGGREGLLKLLVYGALLLQGT